ncbi:hypothetical protein A0J61_04550, partial [Choanephora cucurbitarum]
MSYEEKKIAETNLKKISEEIEDLPAVLKQGQGRFNLKQTNHKAKEMKGEEK